jgi:hypothetical protein
MARRQKLDPHTTDPRDPLELLTRFLVGTSYRVPAQGRGHGSMTTSDIAGAVGLMRDRVAKGVVVAVATRADWRGALKASTQAYRCVFKAVSQHRPKILNLHQPANRMRLRIATYDAMYELIHPEHRKSYAQLAKEAKCRRDVYTAMHKVATSVLQEQLNNGRREFTWRLYHQGQPSPNDETQI